ncbi:MAG: aldo/keto reductase [Clostridia bacterium]|nr:aldo/keto reductase [Clostridia bacterium]
MNNKKSISLGCMRIDRLSVCEAEKLILSAVEQGITLFDHADIYGGGKCELLFGQVLKRNLSLREKITIQSKCGICSNCYNSSKEHIIAQAQKSIANLQCGYLDILLIHRPDALVEYDEVNEAFNYLYSKGLVKHFGVSNMNAWQIELYLKHLDLPIEYNQLQFSAVHSHMISQGLFVNMNESESNAELSSGLIEYCQLRSIKIQAWSSLMASWEDGCFIDNPKYFALNEKLAELALKYSVSKSAVAIAWILRHPANITPIVGTTSVVHLNQIMQSLNFNLTREEWYAVYKAANHRLP